MWGGEGIICMDASLASFNGITSLEKRELSQLQWEDYGKTFHKGWKVFALKCP